MRHSRVAPPQSETRPRHGSVDRTARRCRTLALEFMSAATSWTKLDLASWLLEYGRVAWADAAREPRRAPPGAPVSHERLREAVLAAHRRVNEILDSAGGPDIGSAIIVHAFLHDLVLDYQDETGRVAWAPFDQPRLALADRVLSLFAVDCLTSRDDYARGLCVCHDCGRVSLAAERGDDPNCEACSWAGERVSEVSIRDWVANDAGVLETFRPPQRRAG
jgi:hypothetical protein